MAKKLKRELVIPDLKSVTIFQSNMVTNAKADYTLIQQRVFTFIMYYLQYEIGQIMKGASVHQLDIFKQHDTNMLAMTFPLYHLGSASQYRDIRKAINEMMGVKVIIKTLDKNQLKWGGLFSAVTMPNHDIGERLSTITIEMRRDIAQTLIDVHFVNGRAEQYTKYMLYVALEAKTKYTIKIYQLLCSYREKRVYTCTVEELREILCIPAGVLVNFNDLYRTVLVPVAIELKQIADLFFDPTESNFKVFSGRKIIRLNFTVLFPVTDALFDRNKSKLFKELIGTYGCREHHINELLPYLTPDVNWNKIDSALARCYYMCNKGLVDHPAAFVKRALITELAPV